MCIIIDNSNGKRVSDDIITTAVWINSDGFGITWLDEEVTRTYWTMDMREAEDLLAQERPYVAHCRYTTRGKTSIENNHPFELRDGTMFYHNGTIKGITPPRKGMSDTATMALLLDMVEPNARGNFLQYYCNGNRFCLVHTDGSVLRIGDWHEYDGAFYSKDEVLPTCKTDVYGNGNYGMDYYYSKEHYSQGDDEMYDLTVEQTARLLDDEFNNRFGYHTESYDGEHYYDSPFETEDCEIIQYTEKTTVAVYGTLKKGLSNHGLLENAYYIGEGETDDPMRLCVNGLPYMIAEPDEENGLPVSVELYLVNDEELAALDQLEGHPEFYKREKRWFNLNASGSAIQAWVYMVDESYDTGDYQLTYAPAPPRRRFWTPSSLK